MGIGLFYLFPTIKYNKLYPSQPSPRESKCLMFILHKMQEAQDPWNYFIHWLITYWHFDRFEISWCYSKKWLKSHSYDQTKTVKKIAFVRILLGVYKCSLPHTLNLHPLNKNWLTKLKRQIALIVLMIPILNTSQKCVCQVRYNTILTFRSLAWSEWMRESRKTVI